MAIYGACSAEPGNHAHAKVVKSAPVADPAIVVSDVSDVFM
jgi:hypothetical protein